MTLKLTWALIAGLALATLAPPTRAQDAGPDPYAAVMKRDFGTAIDEMTEIEKEIEAAPSDQYPGFEDHLLAIIDSPDATKPGKQFACQMLRLVGSPKCIASVSKLLADEQLSHIARYVLLPMRVPEADAAFRQALAQTQGVVQIGIINSLGDRRDAGSLKALAALVNSPDELTGNSALNAIGKIGGAPAAATLDQVKAPDALKPVWAVAYLRVADSLAAAGDKAHTDRMLRVLLKGAYPPAVRAGALRTFALDQKEKSVPIILQSLASTDPLMKRAAVTATIAVPGHPATVAFAQNLRKVPAESVPALLAALAARGDAAGLSESVNKLATDADPAVHKAAVLALGPLGNASSVSVLTAMLKDRATRGDASRALGDLHGVGVVEALVQKADAGDPEIRSAVLGILAQRGQAEALPSFRKACTDTDPQVRLAGLRALATLGTPDDLQRLSEAILTIQDDSEREEAGNAMSAIGLRMGDETSRSAPILQAYARATPAAKIQLLAVLASLGGDKAFQGVEAALTEDGEVHAAAIRGLAEWSNTAPMADLRTAAKDDKDKTNRIVALRGYIRMIANSGQPPEAKAQAYQEAIGMAERPDEKRQALGGLGDVSHIEALKAVQPYLDDPDVKQEAFLAYEKIAESLSGSQPDAAKEALQRVADNAADNNLRNKAKSALARIR